MPKRCACLTMDDPGDWNIDTDLAFPPLRELGWQVDTVRWRSESPDWDDYDAVYIGTPWDYPEDPVHFLDVLATIDRSGAVLVNDLALVHWTLEKTYLRDLEARGIDIVPSRWHDDFSAPEIAKAFDVFAAETIIVKPVIGANAIDAFLLDRHAFDKRQEELKQCYSRRSHVVQKFIGNVCSDGEYSLFYFNGEFSHAIRKVPAAGDFRVQEEYGASLAAIEPGRALAAAGERVISLVEPLPVYARLDFVRDEDGRFLLMELELIEPSLYLRMDEAAPRKFAAAFDAGVSNARQKREKASCGE